MSDAGNAEPQLGPTHRGWYSRGYLPHCDHPGLLQSITYHLADSLPAAVLEQMDAELRTLPPERQDTERRRSVEAWLDAGHGSCVLLLPRAAACVVDTWRHFAGERYDLIAWVVMPNHVHVLVRVYDGVPLAKIVQSWKSYTARRIRAMMEAESRAGARRSQDQGVWMREYWDRYIRDERHFQMAVDYIHQNPVKARLVGMAKDWPWSSAREFDFAELGLGGPGAGSFGDAGRQLCRLGEQGPADRQRSCLKERGL
jgi:REP element-mobilizing transposase RayT